MGRNRAYTTTAELSQAVNHYFDTISRMEDVTEQVPTGAKDQYGHTVYQQIPVKNALGEIIRRRVFFIPPDIYGLCEHLGIHKTTWERYCQLEIFREVTQEAEERMLGWKSRQLLERENKRINGLTYELERNHKGWAKTGASVESVAPMEELSDAQLLAMADQMGA